MTILSQLFVDTNDATYIYNQGRCFEQNARYTEAIARFREYLTVGRKLTTGDKAAAQKHMTACEAMLAKQRPSDTGAASPEKAPPAVPAVAIPAPPLAAAKPEPVATAERIVVRSSETGSRPGHAWRTTGVIVAGVGGAALVAGLILNLKVNGMAEDYRRLNGYSDAKESDRKTYETLGWVGYGVGAACIATGSVLYLLGHRAEHRDDSPMAIAPAVSNAGVGATLHGRF